MKNGLKISANGDKFWYKENKLHRENGPAVEYFNGTKLWYKNDMLHRDDGPAVEYFNGTKGWFYYSKYIDCTSTEEFIKLLKLKVFW